MATFALFGDSVAHGLGVKDQTYGQIVASENGAELRDFSRSAMTVSESLAAFREVDLRPDLAIVAHGITEAIPRPSARAVRLVPRRWRPPGWLDPRPYFSTRRMRALVQRVESAIRWRVKLVLLRVDAPTRLLPLNQYVSDTHALVDELRARGSQVLLVCPTAIDDRFFPDAACSQQVYLDSIKHLDVAFVPTVSLHRWDDYCADHFHPNDAGHRRIAAAVISAYRAGLGGSPPHPVEQ